VIIKEKLFGSNPAVNLRFLMTNSYKNHPLPALKSTLPPPAVDSMTDKKFAFNSGIFSLPQIPRHPVSTAGGGIKGGGS